MVLGRRGRTPSANSDSCSDLEHSLAGFQWVRRGTHVAHRGRMDHDEAQACFEPEDAQCAPPPQVSTPPAEEPTACAGPPTAEVEKARAQLYQSMYDHNDTAGEYANKDPALDPIKAAINNPDLSSAERAQMMLDYRDKQMQDVDRDAMNAMKANDPNYALN